MKIRAEEFRMKAVVFDRSGSPLEVLRIADIPLPVPAAGEALVRMIAAPVSPGDFLFIENLYPEPKRPKFPGQVGGNHGAGIVERAPAGTNLVEGSLVAFSFYNSWAEYAAVPAEWLISLPDSLAPEKAAQFFNLITAWDLLDATEAKKDDWIAVTAGNATVSQMVLQFAEARGINVIPLVRRLHADLAGLGAPAVIELESLDRSVGERIAQITNGRRIVALIDNVGGPVTGELIRAMAFGGQVIINGGMSPERFELHNFDVLLSGLEIRSHVYRYFFDPPKPEDMPTMQAIAAASDSFRVPIGGMNALEDYHRAVTETLSRPERGKQFFNMRQGTPHVTE
jgi:NADPH:quinone reductase-like Zn-dependent oxidoreductase